MLASNSVCPLNDANIPSPVGYRAFEKNSDGLFERAERGVYDLAKGLRLKKAKEAAAGLLEREFPDVRLLITVPIIGVQARTISLFGFIADSSGPWRRKGP